MGRRVLVTTDVVGGIWDFSMTLARALQAQRAAHVTLVALGRPSSTQANEARAAEVRLIAEPLKLEWMQGCEIDVRRTRELIAGLVADLRVDVLHANQFAAACAEVHVPVVLTLHSDVLSWRRWTLGAEQISSEWHAYARLVRTALRRADRIVAVSRFLADQTRDLYDCERDIDVVYNGWSAASPVPDGHRAPATLVAGRAWDAAKNVALAAEAAQGWDCGPIYLAGQQEHPESGGRVEAPPPLVGLGYLGRAELERVMRTCPVYLSPARYDPFGLLPLQAALNGCALLLSNIPSYREVWSGAAAFFGSDDAVDLRRQWSRLLDEPQAVRDLARRAGARAVERYSATSMAQAYGDLYAVLGSVVV